MFLTRNKLHENNKTPIRISEFIFLRETGHLMFFLKYPWDMNKNVEITGFFSHSDFT